MDCEEVLPKGGEGVTTERRPARKTCVWHCSTCGQHFHSVGAFDAHRLKGYCVEGAEAVNLKGVKTLQPWTEAGACDLMPGCFENGRRVRYMEPVTVWQEVQMMGKTAEAFQERLARTQGLQGHLEV